MYTIKRTKRGTYKRYVNSSGTLEFKSRSTIQYQSVTAQKRSLSSTFVYDDCPNHRANTPEPDNDVHIEPDDDWANTSSNSEDTNHMQDDLNLTDDDVAPIFEGSDITKAQLNILVMLYVQKHKLTTNAFSDLLNLIVHLLPTGSPHLTVYKVKSFFNRICGENKYEDYFLCNTCFKRLTKDTLCNDCVNSSQEHFMLFDIENQLRSMFKCKHYNFPKYCMSSI
jgi:hypothetical protein